MTNKRSCADLFLIAVLSVTAIVFATAALADGVPWDKFNDPTAPSSFRSVSTAIKKLPKKDRKQALQRLRLFLTSPQFEMRRRAAFALQDLGDKSGVPVMIQDLAAGGYMQRQRAIVTLRVLEDKRAIPALLDALQDDAPEIRGLVLATLGELKAIKAFNEIVAHLKDTELPNSSCIQVPPASYAVYALGALGQKKAIPILTALLEEKGLDNGMSTQITQALGTLTGKKYGSDIEKWRAWSKANRRAKSTSP